MVSSSSSSVNWRYDVFVSCYGPDVQRTFLSHLRKELSNNGMKMFDDQWIERGLQTISPQIRRAIRESRISIVVLSKNYASSTLCLDELLEIFKCKKDNEQIVMTVFYGVDPSDVWKQTNEFGKGFKETCAYIKTEEFNQKCRQALEDVRNIDGENFRKWDTESDMIEKIAINVLNQLPVSKSRDIEQGLVVYETSAPNKRKSKSRCFTVMAFFLVINLLLEIASTVADQLSSTRKSYFTRISLAMSVLSVVLSILDLTYKIRAHKACFRCKWPIPWFYYQSHDYRRIFGSFNDTVLLFCVVGGLVVSTINYSFMEKGKDGPIKVSIWPLFFAIGLVVSKFMEKPVISKDHSL